MYKGLKRRRMVAVILPSSSHAYLKIGKRIRSDALQSFLKVLTFAYSFFYLIMQYELQCIKFPQ